MPVIIGSDSFKDRIIKKFLLRNVADINSREQSLLAKINTLSIDEVIYITAVALKDQQLKPALIRKINMFMEVKQCRKRETMANIAKRFEISISGLYMAIHRFKLQLKDDKLLRLYITQTNKATEDKCKNV